MTNHRARLLWAVAGILAAVLAGLAVEAWAPRIGGGTTAALAYLAAWAPMLAAIRLALRGTGARTTVAQLGLRIHLLDIFWGVALGFAARATDSFLRLLLAQPAGPDGQPTLGAAVSAPAVALGLLAPVVIVPFVEELFFRGLLQRTLTDTPMAGSFAARAALAVLVTSIAFAAVHVILAARTPADIAAIAAGTFVFSLGSGLAAAATGRLGASILGHAVFNGLGLWLAGAA